MRIWLTKDRWECAKEDLHKIQIKIKTEKIMTKTQKNLLVAAAIAGLVGGAVVKANIAGNDQHPNIAGQQVSDVSTNKSSCNGCSHTNKMAGN